MGEAPPQTLETELIGPLTERIETLERLLGSLMRKLAVPNKSKTAYEQLEEYGNLAAEQARAVLAYSKIAAHWPPHLQQQVQKRLETALHSYENLLKLLDAQKNILAQRRQNMENSLQQKGRNQREAPGRIFNLEC